MNKLYIYILSVFCLTGCQEKESFFNEDKDNAVELTGVEAAVSGASETRAAALDKDNYVGRSVFEDKDKMVLTTIKRTANADKGISSIPSFSYHDIGFDYAVAAQQTSGSWTRNETTGGTEDAPTTHPDRIYWSDATNAHTYIGFSVPQQKTGIEFDWKMRKSEGATSTDGIDTYYGSLGDPTIGGNIDYSNDNDDQSSKSGNTKIKYDDLLLTYDDKKVAEIGGSVAKLYYHHALANVRVVVNISGFSATSESADARSVVENMILKDMLTMYKWRQLSYGAQALESSDGTNLNDIYKDPPADHSIPSWNQKKDVHMWIPRPDGTGTGTGKQFTFYALAVPTTMNANSLNLQFTVKYQDPMDPWTDADKKNANMKTHKYTATMPTSIEFRAGWCTTINITLDHRNEKMTVGAEYMDWQFVPTPDEGELKKNSTFLTHADREKVTIAGDTKATADDATWLYIDGTTIKDIYGNDGSETNPYTISTADQLLSFAYEVWNGRDFKGKYVKLDADITMQPNAELLHDNTGFYTLDSEGKRVAAASGVGVTWPGIGDDAKDSDGKYIHAFNGVFNGGYRHINKLYGASFFNTIGEDGIVDHLFMSDALGINGRGSIAEVNYGVICGAYIEGDVVATKDSNTTGEHSNCCGSIVGENHSMLISCAHIGDIKGTGYEIVGALLGYNDGIVAICYNCGDVNGNGVAEYAGIGDYSPRSIAYCSYFNGDLYKGHGYGNLNARIGHVAYLLTTAVMQSNAFVNKPANLDGDLSKDDELFDDGLHDKTDPFFFHLSLNYGIRRAVAMLKTAMTQQEDSDGKIIIHNLKAGEPNPYDVLKLKKTLVQWLIDHYSKEKTPGGELEFSHQFQFIPGTYPKLQ